MAYRRNMGNIVRDRRYAMQNLSRMRSFRKQRGVSIQEVAMLLGLNENTLKEYEKGRNVPSREVYNKLAKFYGWTQITREDKPAPRKPQNYPAIKLHYEEPVKLPKNPEFFFYEGHLYRITTKRVKGLEKSSTVEDGFIFRYERKEGIHHIFREAAGGWLRTYTDAQLVGKNILEVNT